MSAGSSQEGPNTRGRLSSGGLPMPHLRSRRHLRGEFNELHVKRKTLLLPARDGLEGPEERTAACSAQALTTATYSGGPRVTNLDLDIHWIGLAFVE